MITYEYCVSTISSKHFPANQKVCDSLKTAYGTDVTGKSDKLLNYLYFYYVNMFLTQKCVPISVS